MRAFLIAVAALLFLTSAESPVSAASAPALAKQSVEGQAKTLIEKAGWRHRKWRRRYYGPKLYGYRRWYGPRKYGFRRWYGPRVYGYYYYSPYRYRRWNWRRRLVVVGP